jgi:organic hydroperoxide reductase OsmC/OhrA
MDFSAPPDAHGHEGVLTPEDSFVAAVNTCIMMMFLWACERFRLDLVSYRCHAEGTKRVELDHTELFTHLRLLPEIVVRAGPGEAPIRTEGRVRKALASAQKYSLVANSVKSEIIIEPSITVISHRPSAVSYQPRSHYPGPSPSKSSAAGVRTATTWKRTRAPRQPSSASTRPSS